MSVLLIADIHSNLPAFEAVLEAAGEIDEIWFLGDLVGYGPHPAECVALLRTLPHRSVIGNHDLGALGRMDTTVFNPAARQACDWTAERLGADDRRFLDGLPESLVMRDHLLIHASPRNPAWEYLETAEQAQLNFDCFSEPIAFVGHTHRPVAFERAEGGMTERLNIEGSSDLNPTHRYLINPGSVGQPRDGDWRAAFALFDPEARRLEHRRCPYDVVRVQKAMREAGLPGRLIERLAYGR